MTRPLLLRRLLDGTADLHAPGEPPCRFRIRVHRAARRGRRARRPPRRGRRPRLPPSPPAACRREARRCCARWRAPTTPTGSARSWSACAAASPRSRCPPTSSPGFPGETDAEFQETLDAGARLPLREDPRVSRTRAAAGRPRPSAPTRCPPEVKARPRRPPARAWRRAARRRARAARRHRRASRLVESLAMSESYFERLRRRASRADERSASETRPASRAGCGRTGIWLSRYEEA